MKKHHIFFVLLFAVVLFPKQSFACFANTTYNAWNYCKPITVAGSTAGSQTNYQMKVVLPYVSGMKSDFSDVRFVGVDEATALNFWMESETDNTTATFWVKVPSIPASPGVTYIYVYYGNSSVTSISNGSNTFPLFDTFGSGTTPGAWNYDFNGIGEHGTIHNGELYEPLTDNANDGTYTGLVILNPADGSVINHFSIPQSNYLEAAPAIDNNGFIHVYSLSGPGGSFLEKINQNTGATMATLNISSPGCDWEEVPYDSTNDNIFIVLDNGGLRAVHAADYSTAWTNTDVYTNASTECDPPLIVGSYVYWQDFHGKLFKINSATGATVTSSTAVEPANQSLYDYANMTYDPVNNWIYLTNNTSHTVFAVNATDLSIVWSKVIDTTGWNFYRGIAYHNNVLYVTDREIASPYRSKLYALNTQNNGSIVWTNTTAYDNGAEISGMIIDDNYVYAGVYDYADQDYDKLLVINISDGTLAEAIPLLDGVASSVPVAYNGKIIIGLWDTFSYQALQVRSGGGTGDFTYKADNNMDGYAGANMSGSLVTQVPCDYSSPDPTKWVASGFIAITDCSSISTMNLSNINRHVTSVNTFSRANTAIRIRAKNESVGNAFDVYEGFGNGIVNKIANPFPLDWGEYNGNFNFNYDQNASPQSVTSPTYSANQYNTTEIKMAYPNLEFDVNDVPVASIFNWSTSYDNVPIQLGNNRSESTFDWALVRNYTYPEPTISSIGPAMIPPPVGSGGLVATISPLVVTTTPVISPPVTTTTPPTTVTPVPIITPPVPVVITSSPPATPPVITTPTQPQTLPTCSTGTTATTTYDFGSNNLALGDHSNTTKELQLFLNRVMHTGLNTDGIFGKNTMNAVKLYQTRNCLTKVDGIVGLSTREVMNGR